MMRRLTLSTVIVWSTVSGAAFGQTPDETAAEPSPSAEGDAAPDAAGAADAPPDEEQPEGAPPDTGASDAETPAVSTTSSEATAAAEASGCPKHCEADKGRVPDLLGGSSKGQPVTLGLSPGAPQSAIIPSGMTPAFGSQPLGPGDWRFDVHGFLLLPLRVGINERERAFQDQRQQVLHTPPVVPGDYESFGYTAINPDPWAQLNFSYGNRDVTATVIVAARTVSNANGYFNPPDQLGINDAFLSFHPVTGEKFRAHVDVGAFANRYGAMGEYDLGRYNTPLIARVSGMGATGTLAWSFDTLDVTVEAGAHGQLNKAPVGVEPAGWNGFTDPNVGTTFAVHGHASVALNKRYQLGLHYIRAFAQDDRATTTTQPDGSIDVFGVDARATMGRFGHLFLGGSHTSASTARSVSGVLRVLNAPGGKGLMDEYLGDDSNGTGSLTTVGGQYDFSLGNLLRYPKPFSGNAPDLILSAFSVFTAVGSEDAAADGKSRLKFGAEASYSLLSWFGVSARYDRVMLDMDDASQSFDIISPRLVFKSDWSSNDQVMIQYSRYFNGSGVAATTGYPPAPDPTVEPDADVISLTGSMWW